MLLLCFPLLLIFFPMLLTGLFATSGLSGGASGAVLQVFKPFFGQFSVYLSVDVSEENRRTSFYLLIYY